jgi:hypothetical protein
MSKSVLLLQAEAAGGPENGIGRGFGRNESREEFSPVLLNQLYLVWQAQVRISFGSLI